VVNSLRTHRIKPNQFTMTPNIYKQIAYAGGLPMIAVVVALATDSVGFDGGPNPWCFLVDADWLEWTFFYGPICIMTACACFFMACVIYTISKRLVGQSNPCPENAQGNQRVASRRAFNRFVQYNKRPLVFIIMGIVWFIFLISNKLDSEVKKDEYEEAMMDLGRNLLTDPSFTGKTPELRPNFGLEIGLVIVVPGLGLFAIAVYGFNIVLYQKWRSFFENNCMLQSSMTERGSRGSLAFNNSSIRFDDVGSTCTETRSQTGSRGASGIKGQVAATRPPELAEISFRDGGNGSSDGSGDQPSDLL